MNVNEPPTTVNRKGEPSYTDSALPADLSEAESVLTALADVFFLVESNLGQTPLSFIGQAQRELPDLSERYRILVEQIPAVVFMAFFDRGISEAYVSPQIERTLGFTQEEWLRDPVRWYKQIHPDDKGRWSIEAAQTFLTGEPLHSVYRVLTRDERVVWFQCEVKMVRHTDGRPWFIHGVGFDITDLKQTEAALSRNEEMLRGIFEYAPDTMLVVDHNGRIERVNAQVEEMFGYRRDELLGQQVEVLLPEKFRQHHVARRTAYTLDPHLRPMGAGLTLYGKRKDGSEFPVEIMLSPVTAASGRLVIAVIRDISRRKHNEEALREYAERMEILSRRLIAVQEAERRKLALELHDEIGQILTGLKLKLEMSAKLTTGAAHASLTEAQTLVNELMTHTRKLSLDLRPATLDHLGLLPTLLMHIRQYSSQTQVRVDFGHSGLESRRFAPEIETAAFRIVQEALTNVARHSGAQEAKVRIWADQHTLAVDIENSGKGFDVETVFAAGQGNGLTGMRERALLSGGQWAIESTAESGTRVVAEWNLSDTPDSPMNEEK
ncbi:MAG: PAS domain S-box protein [Acidobacteriota bacterium]